MKYCMTQLHRDIGEMHTNWLVSKTSMSKSISPPCSHIDENKRAPTGDDSYDEVTASTSEIRVLFWKPGGT
jgi:hypothetical protein